MVDNLVTWSKALFLIVHEILQHFCCEAQFAVLLYELYSAFLYFITLIYTPKLRNINSSIYQHLKTLTI